MVWHAALADKSRVTNKNRDEKEGQGRMSRWCK